MHFRWVVFLCTLAASLRADDEGLGGDFFSLRDVNEDGRVSQSEFGWGRNDAVNEAFACLDADMSGYITRGELDTMRQRFERTEMHHMDGKAIKVWMLTEECVTGDVIGRHADHLLKARVFGHTMWDFLLEPSQVELDHGVSSVPTRKMLFYSICKEIAGFGCLTPPAVRRGLPPGYLAWSVTRGDFTERQLGGGIAPVEISDAFNCMNGDTDDEISPFEFFQARARFYRSWLAHQSVEDVITWISELPCIESPDGHGDDGIACRFDVYAHTQALQEGEASGPSLFNIALADPSLLLRRYGFEDYRLRHAIIRGVCDAMGKAPSLEAEPLLARIIRIFSSTNGIIMMFPPLVLIFLQTLHMKRNAAAEGGGGGEGAGGEAKKQK